MTPDSSRSGLSCFGEVLQGRLARHPGIGRAFLIQENQLAKAENDRLIVDGLMALASFMPFGPGDYVFIDRSTEAGTLNGRLGLLQAACAPIGLPLRNIVYVSQTGGRVCPPTRPAGANAPHWMFFNSYLMKFARTYTNRDDPAPGVDCAGKVLCMNNKIRPHRIAVALMARRLCQERLILSWRGKTSIYSLEQATTEFRKNFPSLSGESVMLEERSLDVDADLGDVYGVPMGPATESFLHIVTESDYLPWSDRFTEKLLKPVVAGRPFLVFGPPRILQVFRSLGFRTFADVFDESYDQTEEPEARLVAIMRTLEDLLQRDYRAVLEQCAAVCVHNRRHLRFGLEDRLLGMLDRRLGEITG